MKYLWSSLVCLSSIVAVSVENSPSKEDASQQSDSAPELAQSSSSGASEEEYHFSDSESGPELLLESIESNNSKLDYDTSESDGPVPILKPKVHAPLEDLYIKYYGNDPFVERCWTPLREMNSDEDEDKMKSVCIEYHKLAKKGTLKPDRILVGLDRQVLKFRTKQSYRSVHIDVVWYGINDTGVSEIEDLNHHYITRGSGSDCVFYLTPTDKTAMEFYLEEHVCKNSATALQWNAKKTTNAKKNSVVKKGKYGKLSRNHDFVEEETGKPGKKKHDEEEEEETEETEKETEEGNTSKEETDVDDEVTSEKPKNTAKNSKKSSKKGVEKKVTRSRNNGTLEKTVKSTSRSKSVKTTKKVERKAGRPKQDQDVKNVSKTVGRPKVKAQKKADKVVKTKRSKAASKAEEKSA